ncbi:MAG: PKD domain-containing protein [Promethearchaeota archaeon]
MDFIIVVVDLVPVAEFEADQTTIFEGESVAFTFTGSEGNYPASYAWDFGDGGTSTLQDPSHIYANAGSYTVSLTVTDSDGDSDVETKVDFIIVIGDLQPVAEFEADQTFIFEGESVAFTFTGSEGNGPASFAWDFGDGETSTLQDPTHVYVTAGTYTVTLTVTDSDGDSDIEMKVDFIIVVADLVPVAEFEADQTTIIEGESVSFTFTGSVGNGPATFAWDFGDGGVSNLRDPTHVYTTAGTYTVTLTVTDSDGDSDIETKVDFIIVVVDLQPIAEFEADQTTILEGESVTFTFTGSEGDSPASFVWDFGDGGASNLRDPTHVYVTAGTYTVTLTVTDSDGDSDTETKIDFIVVIGDLQPVAEFEADQTFIFEGEFVSFTFIGSEGNGPTSFAWDFGDGETSTLRDPAHVYVTAGTYTVTLTVTDSDGDSDTETKVDFIIVVVDLQPVAEFEADQTTIYEGESVAFTFTGSVGNGPATFAWDFGDGATSTVRDPTHIYATAGTYTVSLTVTDSDGDSDVEMKVDFIIVVVDLQPVADFMADQTTILVGDSVTFTFTGSEGDSPASFAWDFGDGSTSIIRDPTHVYTTAGTYTVTLTVTDSDGDSDTETKVDFIIVVVDLEPVAEFEADQTFIFEGESVSFTFTGSVGNGPTSFAWDFGDGGTSILQDPSHIYATAGTYTVTLTVTDSDGDSDTETKVDFIIVVVDLQPVAEFEADQTTIYEGESVAFTFTGSEGDGPATFAWDFGDGATSTVRDPIHVYATAGTYTVTLTVTDSDGDSDVETKVNFIIVIVDLQPIADFIADQTTILVGDSVTFTFIGSEGDSPASFAWDFGDGGMSTIQDPTHVYTTAGTYTVSLTVTDSDGDSDVETKVDFIIVVSDLPPSKVTGLTAVVVSDTEVYLEWDANMESDFDHYNIYRDGIKIAETTSNSYSDTGLISDVTYIYEVSAVDAADQEGLKSDPVSVTTGRDIEQILNDIENKLDELGDLIDENLRCWQKIVCRIYYVKARCIVEYMIRRVELNLTISQATINTLKLYIALIKVYSRDSEIRQLCSEIDNLINDLEGLI